jgi:hypothetical protein
MRKIELHPVSLAVGSGVAALAFLAMSQAPVTPVAVRGVQYAAHPRDYVQIEEGTPFVVPAGKLFVPTAIGTQPPMLVSATWELLSFTVDGVVQFSSWKALVGNGQEVVGNGSSMRGLPTGLAVPSGALVEVRDSNSSVLDSRVWGFLADA